MKEVTNYRNYQFWHGMGLIGRKKEWDSIGL